jgi:hypothetical protein
MKCTYIYIIISQTFKHKEIRKGKERREGERKKGERKEKVRTSRNWITPN